MLRGYICACLLLSASAHAINISPYCVSPELSLFVPQYPNSNSYQRPPRQTPIHTPPSVPMVPRRTDTFVGSGAANHVAAKPVQTPPAKKPMYVPPEQRIGPLTTKPINAASSPESFTPDRIIPASKTTDPIYAPSNADLRGIFDKDLDHGKALYEFINKEVLPTYQHELYQLPASERKVFAEQANLGFRVFLVREYSARMGIDPAKVSGANLHLVDLTNNFAPSMGRMAMIAGGSGFVAKMAASLTSFSFNPRFYGFDSLQRIDKVSQLLTKDGIRKLGVNLSTLATPEGAWRYMTYAVPKSNVEALIAMMGTIGVMSVARGYNATADMIPFLRKGNTLSPLSANRNPMQPELGNVDLSTLGQQMAMAWVGRSIGENSLRIVKALVQGEGTVARHLRPGLVPEPGILTRAEQQALIRNSVLKSIPADMMIAGVVVTTMTMVAKAMEQIRLEQLGLPEFLQKHDLMFKDVPLDATLKQYVQSNRGADATLQGLARVLATSMVVTSYKNPAFQAILKKVPGGNKIQSAFEFYHPQNGEGTASSVARWGSFAGVYYFMWPYTESALESLRLIERPKQFSDIPRLVNDRWEALTNAAREQLNDAPWNGWTPFVQPQPAAPIPQRPPPVNIYTPSANPQRPNPFVLPQQPVPPPGSGG